MEAREKEPQQVRGGEGRGDLLTIKTGKLSDLQEDLETWAGGGGGGWVHLQETEIRELCHVQWQQGAGQSDQRR